MIENANNSKTAGEYTESKKYIGVASVSIVAVNPDNAKLRSLGWNIPDGAEEPVYSTEVVKDNGAVTKKARVRFLVQIQDLEDKPIVPLDFWIRPEALTDKNKTKGKIIDEFVRTAWGTKEELRAGKIPMYQSGPANISAKYMPCHFGEEELLLFLKKFLNLTPLYEYKNGQRVLSKAPGKITIDNWQKICDGDVTEIIEDIAYRPDNRMKVCFGVRTGEDNKTYQTYLKNGFVGNGVSPDRATGDYARIRTLIDEFNADEAKRKQNDPSYVIDFSFDARPVHVWSVTPTAVQETSFEEAVTEGYSEEDDDDLPFE